MNNANNAQKQDNYRLIAEHGDGTYIEIEVYGDITARVELSHLRAHENCVDAYMEPLAA